MQTSNISTILLALATVVPAFGQMRVPIDRVPTEFTPHAGAEMPERVFESQSYFEVDKATARAMVVVDYSYPDEAMLGSDGGYPALTKVQLAGLVYDSATSSVVYDANGERTVCAHVESKAGVFGTHSVVRPTGACTVESEIDRHAEDDGWAIHQEETLDTYLRISKRSIQSKRNITTGQ